MAPFAAALPYNAAPDAPFKIVILSISSGFKLEIPSPPSLPVDPPPVDYPQTSPGCDGLKLARGTPSTTYNG